MACMCVRYVHMTVGNLVGQMRESPGLELQKL